MAVKHFANVGALLPGQNTHGGHQKEAKLPLMSLTSVLRGITQYNNVVLILRG